ncbi:MAG: hypothetical protein AABZ23_06390 [Deltaproteobacteria bacterium]
MAIISFSKDVLVDYVPAYGGNRESDNPCVVRIRFVPYGRVQDYSRLVAAKAKGLSSNDISKINEITADIQKKQFIENVDSVDHFMLDGREVKDASLFYEYAPKELIYEIIRAMEDSAKLSDGQRKN